MTTPTPTPTTLAGGGAPAPADLAKRTDAELVGTQGRTTIADSVVQKIASLATREVAGVHDLGGGVSRTFGSIREKIPGTAGPSLSQGVSVEVGEKQAAVDLSIVVEYGVPIAEVAGQVRRNVINRIERMTGLEVTEVNVEVNDIYLGTDDDAPRTSRVE